MSNPNVAPLLREARRYLGVAEHPLNSNRGLEIDYWNRESGAPLGSPWCASYVGAVGRQSCGSGWRCPRTASVAALAEWAKAHGVIHEAPEVGDLFVLWFPSLGRFAHVGIVSSVDGGRFGTLEGNSNPGGSRDGWCVVARSRPLDATTRFLRWSEVIA